MRLSHTAARKYALIMSICLLAATDPDHGKLTKMLCICKSGVQCHRVHFATVCASLAKPDRARKSERGSGLKPISDFVPAAQILQLESDWRIGNHYPLLPVV